MVPIAELRSASRVLSGIEGIDFEPSLFIRHRARRCECRGALYYGPHYFNPSDVADQCPELYLTRSMPRQTIRWNGDCFSAWIGGYGDLREIVRRPTSHFIHWGFYSFCFLDRDGHVLVFPSNRGRLGDAVARATGMMAVWSCQALRDGREPGPLHRPGC